MVFHDTTGEQLVCACEEDIPEGYVTAQNRGQKASEPDTSEEEDVHADCFTDADLKEVYNKGYEAGLAAKKPEPEPEPEPAAENPAGKNPQDPLKFTLQDMDLTRTEAKKMLKDEGVKFKGNASSATLASKVKDLL